MSVLNNNLLSASKELLHAQERSILLVEDTASHAALIQRTVSKCNWTIEHVTRGSQAIDSFKNNSNRIVILDLTLPDCDGLDLLRSLKDIDQVQPVLIVTALSDVKKSVLAMKRGASDYVLKDEPKEFASNITNALEKAFSQRIRSIEDKISDLCRVQALIKSERLQVMEEVIKTVCQEVNNPISGLITFADLIKKKTNESNLSKEEYEIIEKLSLSAKKVADAVKRLSSTLPDDL